MGCSSTSNVLTRCSAYRYFVFYMHFIFILINSKTFRNKVDGESRLLNYFSAKKTSNFLKCRMESICISVELQPLTMKGLHFSINNIQIHSTSIYLFCFKVIPFQTHNIISFELLWTVSSIKYFP